MVTSLHHHSTEIVKGMFHHKLTDFFFFEKVKYLIHMVEQL